MHNYMYYYNYDYQLHHNLCVSMCLCVWVNGCICVSMFVCVCAWVTGECTWGCQWRFSILRSVFLLLFPLALVSVPSVSVENPHWSKKTTHYWLTSTSVQATHPNPPPTFKKSNLLKKQSCGSVFQLMCRSNSSLKICHKIDIWHYARNVERHMLLKQS